MSLTELALAFAATGLAGMLMGVGIAWGTMRARLRALENMMSDLDKHFRERVEDHELRLRSVERTQYELMVQIRGAVLS